MDPYSQRLSDSAYNAHETCIRFLNDTVVTQFMHLHPVVKSWIYHWIQDASVEKALQATIPFPKDRDTLVKVVFRKQLAKPGEFKGDQCGSYTKTAEVVEIQETVR